MQSLEHHLQNLSLSESNKPPNIATSHPEQPEPKQDMGSRALGILAKLPAEVRLIIWKLLRSPDKGGKPTCDLNVLRTCWTLYHEVYPIIYNGEILVFLVSPQYQYRSWISVTNRHGATWTLESFDKAMSHGYEHFPYAKIEKIRVAIEAPDPNDPGQLICLCKKISEVVDLLSQVGELRRLEIWLDDSQAGRWVEDERLQRSFPRDNTIPSDVCAIITLFSRLRGFRSVATQLSVPLPERLTCPQGKMSLEEHMKMKEPFGTYNQENQEGRHSDNAIQNTLDLQFVKLEGKLDSISGFTADKMRLERFSSWYDNQFQGKSKYMDELDRILKSESLDEARKMGCTLALKWRYRLMAAFNPLSSKMQRMRFQEHQHENSINTADIQSSFPDCGPWDISEWEEYAKREERLYYSRMGTEGVPDVVKNDGWDRAEWHRYYPDGILPLDPSLWIFELEMGQSSNPHFMTDPRKKFDAWERSSYTWDINYRDSWRTGRSHYADILDREMGANGGRNYYADFLDREMKANLGRDL
jgi:hypothetical protein